ncbi:trimeric intracellular cation channel family protein [Selenomonas sp. F0473]|uniref:trimeric intracellular cation channel family protein n=1 Tax=Selenomonas sp. F0473 TaxID=999423 RepID=UPI00029DF18D|nr:TRIC cation channel family protein [Selenomonas sp. F0473]EKU70796.1 hypothetical protein HMPREF9161_01345 [Selenomonas sp. F0473]
MDAAALWRLFDIIGTIAFAVSGTLVGISRRMDIFGISVLALATAVGGGMARDLLVGLTPPMAQRMPVVLYAEVYAAASLMGAFVFCMLRESLGVEADSWLAFLLVLAIRFAAIRGNWSLYHPRPPRRNAGS